MTRAHDNTRRVCIQHHVLTHDVLNRAMKTIGERIRQAREYRGLSGEQLARTCGYKNQSGISNLENRASTSGGTKIVAIARALDVSVKWVLDGPDVLNMQDVKRFDERESGSATHFIGEDDHARRKYDASLWPFQSVTREEYSRLTSHQRATVEGFVRGLLSEHAAHKSADETRSA